MTTVLAVDDHATFMEYLKFALCESGDYEVVTAKNAEKALECVKKTHIDLALIDVGLPGKDGIWLLKSIQKLRPGMPCLMLSGFASKTYVEKALAAGARGYVLKEDVTGLLEGMRVALSGGTFLSEAAMQPDAA